MECPHLCENNGCKLCKRMKAKGIASEVSNFDIQHYCQGNPSYCYFYRLSKDS